MALSINLQHRIAITLNVVAHGRAGIEANAPVGIAFIAPRIPTSIPSQPRACLCITVTFFRGRMPVRRDFITIGATRAHDVKPRLRRIAGQDGHLERARVPTDGVPETAQEGSGPYFRLLGST